MMAMRDSALGPSTVPLSSRGGCLAGGPGHVAGENPEEIHKVDRQIPVSLVTTLLNYHREGGAMWMARTAAGLAIVFGAWPCSWRPWASTV